MVSLKLAGRSLIVLETLVTKSVCVTWGEFQVGVVVTSVYVVVLERVFVDVETVRNKYWVGFVKFSEGISIDEFCCLIYI